MRINFVQSSHARTSAFHYTLSRNILLAERIVSSVTSELSPSGLPYVSPPDLQTLGRPDASPFDDRYFSRLSPFLYVIWPTPQRRVAWKYFSPSAVLDRLSRSYLQQHPDRLSSPSSVGQCRFHPLVIVSSNQQRCLGPCLTDSTRCGYYSDCSVILNNNEWQSRAHVFYNQTCCCPTPMQSYRRCFCVCRQRVPIRSPSISRVDQSAKYPLLDLKAIRVVVSNGAYGSKHDEPTDCNSAMSYTHRVIRRNRSLS